MRSRYLQLDVFALRCGGGNPLGVVLDAEHWSTTQMQDFAAWTGLVETTFVLPATEISADYRVRIFTPEREIAYAGHPTIGSAHAVLESRRIVELDRPLIQQCQAGLLPIRVHAAGGRRRLLVRAPAARVLHVGADGRLSRLLEGIQLGSLPPAFLDGGRRWWLVEFARETDLRAWRPDHAAIAELARESESLGLCIFARGQGRHELIVRAFPAGVGITEDPASGAANGLIAAWIAAREPEGSLARGYRVSQGREIGHDAEIDVRIEQGEIWVGGAVHTIIAGSVDWPPQERNCA